MYLKCILLRWHVCVADWWFVAQHPCHSKCSTGGTWSLATRSWSGMAWRRSAWRSQILCMASVILVSTGKLWYYIQTFLLLYTVNDSYQVETIILSVIHCFCVLIVQYKNFTRNHQNILKLWQTSHFPCCLEVYLGKDCFEKHNRQQ